MGDGAKRVTTEDMRFENRGESEKNDVAGAVGAGSGESTRRRRVL